MVRCGGILLTGGAGRRFGGDKATALWQGETLAVRAGRALQSAADGCIEVGPGVSGLPAVPDDREGPLVAVGVGWAALRDCDAALVLACDMPLVTPGLLRWLVTHPGHGSVVPLGGSPLRAQPLCARWSAGALGSIGALVTAGERAMRALLATEDVLLVDPSDWSRAAGPLALEALADADTSEELARLARLLSDQP
jgi:molybdopterin-guanine dinucleotide biosynthesis protein A